MKIKIVGWLFIIVGAIFIVGAVITFILGEFSAALYGILGLALGVYSIILGSALRGRKKWAWYAGVITILLATVGNLITIFLSFSIALIVAICIQAFIIYALFSEKSLFFES